MAQSGSGTGSKASAGSAAVADFSLNRDQIITEALILIGAFESGEPIDPNDLTMSANTLNIMVKEWNAQGKHLFHEEEGVIFPVKNRQRYQLHATSGDHATLDDFVDTTVTVNAASATTAITVGSASSMTAGDTIGIELDKAVSDKSTNDLQWNTVAAVSATDSTYVRLSAALAGSATSGAQVYSYTNRMDRPLRIVDGRTFAQDSLNDAPMTPIAKWRYNNISLKGSTGRPTNYFYDPQLNMGEFFSWPVVSSIDFLYKITVQKSVDQFSSASAAADFPSEWINALTYGLAVELAPKFGVYGQELLDLKAIRDEKVDDLLNFDVEISPIMFQPDLSGR